MSAYFTENYKINARFIKSLPEDQREYASANLIGCIESGITDTLGVLVEDNHVFLMTVSGDIVGSKRVDWDDTPACSMRALAWAEQVTTLLYDSM